MASSNTVFSPRWVKAEHSRYFTASAPKMEERESRTAGKGPETHSTGAAAVGGTDPGTSGVHVQTSGLSDFRKEQEFSSFILESSHKHAAVSGQTLTDLLGQSQALRVGDGSQLLFFQLLNCLLLVPQIQLGAHQDDGCGRAVVANLRVPLREHRTTSSTLLFCSSCCL